MTRRSVRRQRSEPPWLLCEWVAAGIVAGIVASSVALAVVYFGLWLWR